MRKIILLCILFACIFVVCGCSAQKGQIKRQQNIKDDEIKFFGFEWLTDLNSIKAKFDKDYKDKPYIITEQETFDDNKVNDTLIWKNYVVTGKNNSSLGWDIGGCEVDSIQLTCLISNEGKDSYLYGGRYTFSNDVIEVRKNIMNKLESMYNKINEEKTDRWYEAYFSDKNGNGINVFQNNNELTITYYCGEVVKSLDKMKEEYLKKQNDEKDDKTGL